MRRVQRRRVKMRRVKMRRVQRRRRTWNEIVVYFIFLFFCSIQHCIQLELSHFNRVRVSQSCHFSAIYFKPLGFDLALSKKKSYPWSLLFTVLSYLLFTMIVLHWYELSELD